ncbi:MAG TPA: M28 family peptidase [Acidobacteriaceae bacterium]|jgi:hypothetical protein|nr:M28 family peptidase [Acidobacteriaceae bacterium]
MRPSAILLAGFLLAAGWAAAQTQASNPGASPRPSANPSPVQTRFYYYKTPQSSLDSAVHDVPLTDAARLTTLQSAFTKVDCTGDRLRTQLVKERHDSGAQNLICTWPSSSPDSIVVVAHYIRRGKGASALDDWSGAVLLPALCFALQVQARHNTWIFLESTGVRGDADFLKSLSPSTRSHIRAVIALDALGLDSTLRFFAPSDTNDPSLGDLHLQMDVLAAPLLDRGVPQPRLMNPGRWLDTDDTRPFRYAHIPVILLHSVPPDKVGLPGSNKDLPSAIDINAYDENYRAITIFLVALDSDAHMLTVADDKFWNSGPGYRLNLNDLPFIH